jgi:hypothetical protein
MSVSEILCEVEAAGVGLRLDGDRIRIWFPEPRQREAMAEQVAFLRTHRDEVAEFLRVRSGNDGARDPYFRPVSRDGLNQDYYGWRAHVAIDAICRIAAPEGLIAWLEEYSPFHYRRLTCDLPNGISQAWNDRVPFEDFDKLCFDLVDAYRRAVELTLALR